MTTAKYEYYDNPDAAGRRRRYRTWWGDKETPRGPVDVELISGAPVDPHPRGQAGWIELGPVTYRVRQPGGAWVPWVSSQPEPFGETAGRLAYGEEDLGDAPSRRSLNGPPELPRRRRWAG